MSIRPEATIYTDGACKDNPGPGGWAAIIISEGKEQELSGGDASTTNNRQELLGVINGLKALRGPHIVTIFSDSKYITDAFNQNWLKNWKANGWARKEGELKNVDLWQELDKLAQKHSCTFKWVKGHNGNSYNERCDKLAVSESIKYSNGEIEPVLADVDECLSVETYENSVEQKNDISLAYKSLNYLLCQVNMERSGVKYPCGANPWCGCVPCTEETGCAYAYIKYHKENGLI